MVSSTLIEECFLPLRVDHDVDSTVRSNSMERTRQFTALIEHEGDTFVALCPELDIASQGETVEEARKNLIEAIEVFFETASPEESCARARDEVFVTRVEVRIPAAP